MEKLKSNIVDIAHNHYDYLLNLENVNGVALGHKYINNVNTLEPCLHVLVKNKVNTEFLMSNNIIPKTYMGIKTDVIEIGEVITQGGAIPGKYRPLQGGCAIGPSNSAFVGTMCCIVKKIVKIDDEDVLRYFILSNNHVLADNNRSPLGSVFLQPNLGNGGEFPDDAVAVLSTFVPIEFIENENKPINYVDAAIAKVINKTFLSDELLFTGKIKGITKPSLERKVHKIGFASGLTSGKIISTNFTIEVKIGNTQKYALFQDQVLCELETMSGDSGGAVVTLDNEIVGMHMGSSKKGFATSNDINVVFEKLKVELYTGN